MLRLARNKQSNFFLKILLGVFTAFIYFILRLDGEYFPGKYRWVGDDSIFIN